MQLSVKLILKTVLFCILFLSTLSFKAQSPLATGACWSRAPFSHKVFVENKGQFGKTEGQLLSSVLFGLRDGGYELFFSFKGIGIRRMTIKKGKTRAGEKEAEKRIIQIDSFSIAWINPNPQVRVIPNEQVADYFTYGDPTDKSGKTGINARAYESITYKDLYPGIDVIFTFADDKQGLKYSIVLHPGADLAKVKMDHSESSRLKVDLNGNLLIDCRDLN